MRHIMHTVKHAALIQAAADFTPHDRAGTPYAEICTLTIEENHRREPREENTHDQLFELTETDPTPQPAKPKKPALASLRNTNHLLGVTMRHIMHTVEHAALVQAAAYGKHRAAALCGKTVDIDLSGYFITYDRTPQRTPAKLPGVCAPCPACRMELHNA